MPDSPGADAINGCETLSLESIFPKQIGKRKTSLQMAASEFPQNTRRKIVYNVQDFRRAEEAIDNGF
ncbi:MAG: hypothetical protein HFH93_02820 [Lachnospiraceae bacterium]|nr:hypothetical protein [Lachnospiraceae bacterium]